jgi:hypothetical protein
VRRGALLGGGVLLGAQVETRHLGDARVHLDQLVGGRTGTFVCLYAF